MGRQQNQNVSESERRPKDRSLTQEDAFTIVLFRPRIPQNTGSIARMCAATGSRLDLISPLFKIDDKKLKRAGLDYWPLLDVCIFESEEEWFEKREEPRSWFVETKGPTIYTEASFQKKDFIVFGDEQEGINKSWLKRFPENHLSIPQQGVRSMNLAMCAGIVTFEALRQVNWLKLNG